MDFKEDLAQDSIIGKYYICSQIGLFYRVNSTFDERGDRFVEVKIPSIRATIYDLETGRVVHHNLVKQISLCSNDKKAT